MVRDRDGHIDALQHPSFVLWTRCVRQCFSHDGALHASRRVAAVSRAGRKRCCACGGARTSPAARAQTFKMLRRCTPGRRRQRG